MTGFSMAPDMESEDASVAESSLVKVRSRGFSIFIVHLPIERNRVDAKYMADFWQCRVYTSSREYRRMGISNVTFATFVAQYRPPIISRAKSAPRLFAKCGNREVQKHKQKKVARSVLPCNAGFT